MRTFLGNIDTTREVRKHTPKVRYPYKAKRYYSLSWPAQAVSRARGRSVLPMGRGRPSLVLPVEVPEQIGACKLVWNAGDELVAHLPPVSPGRAG